MPIRHNAAARPENYEQIFRDLKKELESPTPEDKYVDEPFIIEDEEPRTGRFRVTVIWDGWGDWDLRERGGVILEAYGATRGREQMLNISQALGITKNEAQNIGIVA